ncbi:MAG: carboxylating nicotinate-nucleotide diphosphorylase [Bdellovibrionales bacterium]|nr:carboxylating nicotinate-nucleotide diphosphorylase [Bdellovibrionales bacterium]
MKIDELVSLALEEDMPQGDVTTDGLGIERKPGTAKLVAKEDLILSGSHFFESAVLQCDPTAKIKWQFQDSDLVLNRQIVAVINGDLLQLLKAERTGLNFLGRFSGIASLTKCFVEALGESKTKILDTRKTHPLYRDFEKKAVVDGGGKNHRRDLSDGILIKENHIRAVGDFKTTIARIKEKSDLPIEVETTNLDEVKKAIEMGVQRIMLDNMSDDLMKEALTLIPDSIETEASGNMSIERVRKIKNFGLNFVSVGSITHSAPCADFSLLFDWNNGKGESV